VPLTAILQARAPVGKDSAALPWNDLSNYVGSISCLLYSIAFFQQASLLLTCVTSLLPTLGGLVALG
jgi:hypothetical protein